VSIYIPRQLKDSICSLVLAILNTHQNSRKYILTDIEITSTIVLVTNLPKKISENSMDSLMKGFGRTLSKVCCYLFLFLYFLLTSAKIDS